MTATRFALRSLLAAVGALVLTAAFGLPAATAAPAVPFTDSAATGKLTLCDSAGKAMSGGNINTVPFVWRAVGSNAGPARYNGAKATAVLYAYQPIQSVDPYKWSGRSLTASATFTNPAHPMAAATAADLTLAQLLTQYPTKWDGLLQLRMYLGAPEAPAYTTVYNAATIRVSGSNWTLLDGGGGSCSSGTSTSIEAIALPSVAALPTPTPGQTVRPTAAAGSGASVASAASTAISTGPSVSTGSTDPSGQISNAAAVSRAGSSSGRILMGIVLVIFAIGVALGSFLLWRRRA